MKQPQLLDEISGTALYYIFLNIYLFTAIGLLPGGSGYKVLHTIRNSSFNPFIIKRVYLKVICLLDSLTIFRNHTAYEEKARVGLRSVTI